MYITKNVDIDNYLILTYFEIDTLIKISQINKSSNFMTKKNIIYQQFLSFVKNKSNENIYEYSCANNNLELIISLDRSDYVMSLKKCIRTAAKNNHVNILIYLSLRNTFKKIIIIKYAHILCDVVQHGCLDVLEWLNKLNFVPSTRVNVYFFASMAIEYGQDKILSWLNDNFHFRFTSTNVKKFINYAIVNNHANILEWFGKFYKNKMHNHKFIMLTSQYGHCNILDWFMNFDNKMFINIEKIISKASEGGHRNVLDWIVKHNLKFKRDREIIILAASKGYCQILDWCKNLNYKFTHVDYAIFLASKNGHCNVINWFENSNYKCKRTDFIICDSLNHTKNYILRPSYAIICKCADRTKYFNLLKDNNLLFRYDHSLILNSQVISNRIFIYNY